MLDQNMTRTEGVFVDFFGRPACTTPGLAYLAAQSQAPVVPIFLLRNPDHRHTFRVLPVIDPPPDRQPDTMREYTQRYTAVLEGVIREHPDQWIWIHRRWRTQPASGSDRA
jgi:KDO2-lipid IV(A) lauroyltransferase